MSRCGLVDVLFLISVLGMGGVGWIPLTPAHTPIPAVESVLYYVFATVVSAPVTLAVAVIMAIYGARLASLSINSASSPLVRPHSMSHVGVPTSTNLYLPLLRVRYHIITFP